MISRTSTPNRPARQQERGYVLLVFTLFAVLLVAGVYRILPAMVFQGQRQKEELLIYRGLQYQRAIQLYVRKFGRYPGSLEELENTNQIRFLRQRYLDPMTENGDEGGEWRLIHVGPGGVLIDALHPPGSAPSALVIKETEEPEENDPEEQPARTVNAQPRPVGQAPQSAVAGGIAGVASRNEGASIKRWNGYEYYNEWEFIFDIQSDAIAAKRVASTNPQARPGNPFGNPPTANPGGAPGGPGAPSPPGSGFPGVPGGGGGFPGVPGSGFPGGSLPGFPRVPGALQPGTPQQPQPR